MNRLIAAALLSIALPWGAARADVVRTLERGAAYAAQSKSNHTLTIRTPKGAISLRGDGGSAGTGVIGVEHTFSSTGFFLQKDGKLSPQDRARLSETLTKDHVTRENVVRGLRSSMLSRRAYEAKLATVDGKVDSILADAKLGRSKSYGAHLSFEAGGPSGAMLVVNEGLSQRAIFLDGSKERGYSMSPSDRADVARLLLK